MAPHRIVAATPWVLALCVLAHAISAWADAAPPPPQDVWIGKGQFGFLNSHGNSDAESLNGSIDMLRYDGAWKNEFFLTGLYGKNAGIVSAERWETRGQSNYTISGNLFSFGALRYEHDLFDGFQYQASLTAGLGYKLINTDDTKLTAQAGAGYRRLRPEIIDKDATGLVISRAIRCCMMTLRSPSRCRISWRSASAMELRKTPNRRHRSRSSTRWRA